MVKIETNRLWIRDNVKEDLFKHHLLMSDPEIMSYIQDIQTHSLEESEENLSLSIEESKKENRTCYFFAIILKETKAFIGSVGFTILEKNKSGGNAELGYFILKDYWGKGYTFEATKAVVSFAFETVGLHKLSTGCMVENINSENIMIKLGFEKEGHFKKHVYHNGVWKDRVAYGLLHSDVI